MSEKSHHYQTLTVSDRPNGELRVELDRQSTLNAWNEELGRELVATLEYAADTESVQTVVLMGRGRAFCSGADLTAGISLTPAGKPDILGSLRDHYHPVILGLRELEKPVIAAVNGPAVGIGCSLALACDLIVAKSSAFFSTPFIQLGLMPDGGCSLLLGARVGAARTTEMALTGDRISAEQAHAWGMINAVVADDQFEQHVTDLVARLSEGPASSYAATKRTLNSVFFSNLANQLEYEGKLQHKLAASPQFAARVGAFLAK